MSAQILLGWTCQTEDEDSDEQRPRPVSRSFRGLRGAREKVGLQGSGAESGLK